MRDRRHLPGPLPADLDDRPARAPRVLRRGAAAPRAVDPAGVRAARTTAATGPCRRGTSGRRLRPTTVRSTSGPDLDAPARGTTAAERDEPVTRRIRVATVVDPADTGGGRRLLHWGPQPAERTTDDLVDSDDRTLDDPVWALSGAERVGGPIDGDPADRRRSAHPVAPVGDRSIGS
jgi:hypothetical protein